MGVLTAQNVSFGRLVGTYTPERETAEDGGKHMALILFVEYHATFRQAASYLMDQEPGHLRRQEWRLGQRPR